MEDGAGAAGDVHTQVDGAHNLAHDPDLLLDVDDAKGHDQHGHQEIRGGQGADEVVGRVVQLAGHYDGGDDQAVDDRGYNSKHRQRQGKHDLFRRCSSSVQGVIADTAV